MSIHLIQVKTPTVPPLSMMHLLLQNGPLLSHMDEVKICMKEVLENIKFPTLFNQCHYDTATERLNTQLFSEEVRLYEQEHWDVDQNLAIVHLLYPINFLTQKSDRDGIKPYIARALYIRRMTKNSATL